MIDRVALMGFGSSGQRFASLIGKSLPATELLVYTGQELPRAQFRYSSRLLDVQEFEPTMAVICGAASDRLEMVQVLPKNIRGVLVEKPLATSHQESIRVIEELAKRGCITQVGYNLRFSPSLRELKRKLDNLSFGRVLSVRAETGQYLPDWRRGRDYRTTASARQASGGGVLNELSHEVDYLRWIFGEVEWVSAWCGLQSDLDLDVEDTAHLILGFASQGALSSVVGQLNIDFLRQDRTRSVTVLCEEGTLRWDGIAFRIDEWRRGGVGWDLSFMDQSENSATSYERQWDSFYAAVTGAVTPEVTVTDGAAVMAIIDSARHSNEASGARVSPSNFGLPL